MQLRWDVSLISTLQKQNPQSCLGEKGVYPITNASFTGFSTTLFLSLYVTFLQTSFLYYWSVAIRRDLYSFMILILVSFTFSSPLLHCILHMLSHYNIVCTIWKSFEVVCGSCSLCGLLLDINSPFVDVSGFWKVKCSPLIISWRAFLFALIRFSGEKWRSELSV